MRYSVQLSSSPKVIDEYGAPVPQSHVLEVLFPGEMVETPLGPISTLVGKGIAKILVGEATIRGVPLC